MASLPVFVTNTFPSTAQLRGCLDHPRLGQPTVTNANGFSFNNIRSLDGICAQMTVTADADAGRFIHQHDYGVYFERDQCHRLRRHG